MDKEEADRAVARHHRAVVNSIKVGAYDGALIAILEAERRRDSSRPHVLMTVHKRLDALERGPEDHDSNNG